MAGGEGPRPSVWGGVKTPWSTPSTSQNGASGSSPASSSAFPPLSSQSSSRGSSSQWRHHSSPSASFNPYPTRTQEIAERAQSHAHRRQAQLNRRDPDIATLRSYEHSDDDDSNHGDNDDDNSQVSARGATMSSIIFRDQTASSRSSFPGQSSLSPGLAMFARSSFGGEPLPLLLHMDNELRAAHLGPRIYHRHNQKYVQAKRRGKAAPSTTQSSSMQAQTIGMGDATHMPPPSAAASLSEDDFPRLVQQYRQNTLAEAQQIVEQANIEEQICRLIESKVADPFAWTAGKCPVSHDLIFDPDNLDLRQTLPELISPSCRAVLKGIAALLTSLSNASHASVIDILAQLINLKGLKPSSAVSLGDATLQMAVLDVYVSILELVTKLDSSTNVLAGLLERLSQSTTIEPLRSLTSDLVAFCGQQLAGNPTILDESQDRNLVAASKVLARLSLLNCQRPAASRLPAHAFYCTVLDLCPFLEHFIHHAKTFTNQGPSTDLAHFNVCQYPFLLSLGAKARILQLENELRFSTASGRTRSEQVAFSAGQDSPGRLVMLSNCLKLTVQRTRSREQSQDVLLQLLDHCDSAGSYEALAMPLRVDFDGELAVDGGGPTREWFATVLSSYRPASLASHGWFVPSLSETAVDEARFLGLVLALAALHSTKASLGFDLSRIAFKLATCSDIDILDLACADLEDIDPALAKSLQAVLDWTPELADQTAADAEHLFESTFSLTWSTSVQADDGAIYIVDLVPGGRNRSVKLADRSKFVSKLVWRVLVESVREQVSAFRAGWQAVMPCFDSAERNETSTEVICRGGLAMSLFRASEIAETTCSVPAERGAASHAFQPLDMADLENATVLVLGSSAVDSPAAFMASFWAFWGGLDPVEQRKLLAFITGSQDVPMTGARGIGLRIHLIHAQNLEIACHQEDGSWPLPWSSTCTSTLFLPAYPSSAMMEKKLLIAIEHYRGFGLR